MRAWPSVAAYSVISLALLFGAFPRALLGLKPHEVALLVFAAALVLRRIIRRDGRIVGGWIDLAFAGVLLGGTVIPLITLDVRGVLLTPDAAKTLLGPVEWYLWYRVMLEALPMPQELTRLLWVLLLNLSVIGFVGDVQALHAPGVAAFLRVVAATHQTAVSGLVQRPTSLVGEWGLLGSLCGFALLLINQLATDQRGVMLFRRHTRIWLIALLMINVFAVVATLAVEAGIALVLGYGLAALANRRLPRETLIGIGSAAVALLAIIPLLVTRLSLQFGTTGSWLPATWQVRFLHWQIVLGAICAHPATILFGVGPSFVYPVSQFGGTESLYWLLWYRGGLLYLLAFLILLGVIISTAWNLRAATAFSLERSALTWIGIVFVVISAIGVIDALFLDGGEAQCLLTLMAALGGLAASRGSDRAGYRAPVVASR